MGGCIGITQDNFELRTPGETPKDYLIQYLKSYENHAVKTEVTKHELISLLTDPEVKKNIEWQPVPANRS
jgi:hypothetical protein